MDQDQRVPAYVSLVRTSDALHGEVSRGLAIEGLTATQFSTLKVLRLRGALAQRDIAENLLKSGGNITVVVDNLERAKLVQRTRDTEDRRIVYVELTPLGRETFDRIYPGHLERIKNAMAGLSQEECTLVMRLMDRLNGGETNIPCVPEPSATA